MMQYDKADAPYDMIEDLFALLPHGLYGKPRFIPELTK